jgi:hypothetical protein
MSDDAANDLPRPWSRRRQEVGAIVWSSFLAACFATMVFFAVLDPLLLADDDAPPSWLASRMTGYALGFFFFWIVTALSAVLSSYLLETLPKDVAGDDSKQNHPDRSGRAS